MMMRAAMDFSKQICLHNGVNLTATRLKLKAVNVVLHWQPWLSFGHCIHLATGGFAVT
jgi:hypothetical protein